VENSKQQPKPCRRRIINGALMDVESASAFLGQSEQATRAQVVRRQVPFRRRGGRVVFLRADLEQFLAALPDCDVKEALANAEARR
jgi:hypothetical protein